MSYLLSFTKVLKQKSLLQKDSLIKSEKGHWFQCKICDVGLKIVLNKPAAQAEGQTLPNATPPVGKIPPFTKIAVTFDPIKQFRFPSKIRFS